MFVDTLKSKLYLKMQEVVACYLKMTMRLGRHP